MSGTEHKLADVQRGRSNDARLQSAHPMTLDALARHEDEPATEPVPAYVRSGLSSYRLMVTTAMNPTHEVAHQAQRDDSHLGPHVVGL